MQNGRTKALRARHEQARVVVGLAQLHSQQLLHHGRLQIRIQIHTMIHGLRPLETGCFMDPMHMHALIQATLSPTQSPHTYIHAHTHTHTPAPHTHLDEVSQVELINKLARLLIL